MSASSPAARSIAARPAAASPPAWRCRSAARAQAGEARQFESCTGAIFTGKVVREAQPVGPRKAVIVEVGGKAHQIGEARFRVDDDDPLREGFTLRRL